MPSLFDRREFTSTMFYPSPRVSRAPRGARDLRVEATPGVRLHARFHQHARTDAVVLLFHGNGEVVADYDGLAERYAADAKADLLVVDYRGYGASEGSPTLRACLADARAVLGAALEAAGGRPLVVMGRSLGSACAAELCQEKREGVAGYVFESGIADVYGVVRRRGIALDGPLPEEDLATFCPLRKFRRCETPALVLHGAEDELIPASEAGMAFDALATSDKELVLVPGRGHNDLSLEPSYWDALGRFVARVAKG